MKQSTPPALQHLEAALASLDAEGLLRRRPPPLPRVSKTFCSNDYLGFASSPALPSPSGAGASRLIVGEHAHHLEIETAIASWLGVEAVLLFSSGYAANLGAVSALVHPGDLVVSDLLNHASLIDGSRLARSRVVVVPHLDLDAVDEALAMRHEARAWVLSESYFSMDADGPDLAKLRRICDARGAALILDEAHAAGVLGPHGRGRAAEAGIRPDVIVGALGKAFGASGAFVAGCRSLIDWLWNRARSFVFSTGASPVVAATALRNLTEATRDTTRRERLHENAAALRAGLRSLHLAPLGFGPIIPLVVGDARAALTAAEELRRRDVHVQAVRPPTVPQGSARLRVTVTADHNADDIRRALDAFKATRQWLTPSS